MGYNGNIGKSAYMETIGVNAPQNIIPAGGALPITRNRINNTRIENECDCDRDEFKHFINHHTGTEQIQLLKKGLYSVSIVVNGTGTAPMVWGITDNEGNIYNITNDLAAGAVVGTAIVRSAEGRTTLRIVNNSGAPITLPAYTDPSFPQASIAVTFLGK